MTEVIVTADADEMTALAVDRVSRHMEAPRNEPCSILLSGGSTPQALHRALGAKDALPWGRCIIAFGDERCVPPNHADSNYAAAHESLLCSVHPAGVLRVPGEMGPEAAAAVYASLLDGLPNGRASLAILGMGADGHTASLFPGRPSLDRRLRVAPVEAPTPEGHARVTVTEYYLRDCEEVLVLVSGAAKAPALREAFTPGSELPMARVLRARGNRPTVLVVDEAAASELPRSIEDEQ